VDIASKYGRWVSGVFVGKRVTRVPLMVSLGLDVRVDFFSFHFKIFTCYIRSLPPSLPGSRAYAIH